MAYLLVAEARLDHDPQAMAYFEFGINQLESLSEEQKSLFLSEPQSWPLKKAVSQIQNKENYIAQVREQREKQLVAVTGGGGPGGGEGPSRAESGAGYRDESL